MRNFSSGVRGCPRLSSAWHWDVIRAAESGPELEVDGVWALEWLVCIGKLCPQVSHVLGTDQPWEWQSLLGQQGPRHQSIRNTENKKA